MISIFDVEYDEELSNEIGMELSKIESKLSNIKILQLFNEIGRASCRERV